MLPVPNNPEQISQIQFPRLYRVHKSVFNNKDLLHLGSGGSDKVSRLQPRPTFPRGLLAKEILYGNI